MAWSNVLSADTFIGRGPATPSVSPGSVGNGWTDMATDVGVWGINGASAGDGLYGTTTDGSGYEHNRCLIWQGSGGSATGTNLVAQFINESIGGSSGQYNRVMVVPRWAGSAGGQPSGNNADYYYCQYTGTVISFQAILGLTVPSGIGSTTFSALTVGHTLQLDVFAYGTSPTVLFAQLRDLTAGTVVASLGPFNDSTSGLQVSGQAGFITYANGGNTTDTPTITSALINTGSPPSYILALTGPTTGAVGTPSSNFSVTPDFGGPASNSVLTFSDGGLGGTFTPSSGTISASSTSAFTFTYTAEASGPATISITNSVGIAQTGSPIVYTAGSSSMSISPTTTPGRIPAPWLVQSAGGLSSAGLTSGCSITVLGVGTSFEANGFQVTGGFSTVAQTGGGGSTPWVLSQVNQTIISGTEAVLQFDPGPYANGTTIWGDITIKDTVSGLTATLTVTPPVLNKTINLLFVGASISASDVGAEGTEYGYLSTQVVTYLRNQGYTVNWYGNAAQDGSSTNQWTPTTNDGHNTDGSENNQAQVNGSLVDFPFADYPNPGCYFYRALAIANSARGSSTVGTDDWVHIELGSGDVGGNNPTDHRGPNSISAHHTYMTAIVNGFVALGYKVILSKQIYTWPYGNMRSSANPVYAFPPEDYTPTFPSQPGYLNNYPDEVYQQEWLVDIALQNNTTVYLGDSGAAAYSKANPKSFLQSEQNSYGSGANPGLHPADSTQNQILAYFWGEGIANAYAVAAGGGNVGTPTISIAAFGSGIANNPSNGIAGNGSYI
jgi:hypothetical protein